ncbi:MAG: beta-ketoacyl synthase N-terminal-like domain-containing protein [Thermodesulfobacteriota bacterium]
MERRVVITSAAAISPLGDREDQIMRRLVDGVSGVTRMTDDGLLYSYLHCRVFGAVTYPITYNFSRKYSKTMGPVGFYACQVAKEALEKAGLDKEFISSGRLGVAFGSTQGSPRVQREIFEVFFSKSEFQYQRLNSVDYLRSMSHTTAANIAKLFEITGRVISSSTACTTSSQSIGFGYEAVKYGLQDAMICGGADEYDTLSVAVFDKLLAASHSFNDEPHRTPRPFDRRRDGLVVGEGAGAVLLEELDFARKRGAEILAEVVGFSCCNNGGDMILPSREGIVRTLKTGLDNARLNPDEVDLISAHATATKIGDIIEAEAIHDVYGRGPLVTGLKSYIGHAMGTCGVLETIFTLYMLKHGTAIPTMNLEEVDEKCAMINHLRQVQERRLETASVQNFAFGGVNTALFIKRFQ